jgi:deuterolysin
LLVSALYDFESHGTGAFTFSPITTFQVIPGDKKISEAKISPETALKVAAAKVDVVVTKDVARREMKEKRATVTCTNATYKSYITASYNEGKTLASVASSYIASRGASDSLYRAYFGTASTTTVRNVFSVRFISNYLIHSSVDIPSESCF